MSYMERVELMTYLAVELKMGTKDAFLIAFS
jgi:hypothetical protein